MPDRVTAIGGFALLIEPSGSAISLGGINRESSCYFHSRFPKVIRDRHAGSRNKYLVMSFAARTRARRAGKRGQGILSERTSLAVWGLRGWRLNPKSILRLTLLA